MFADGTDTAGPLEDTTGAYASTAWRRDAAGCADGGPERVCGRDDRGDRCAVRYYLADHLGTTTMELSSGGWPLYIGDFAPYGQEIIDGAVSSAPTDTSSNHYKFTGKERDAESGLDYFGARYYGSSMGRFMSPDWASNPVTIPFANIYDPQSLNLYSYTGNNPHSRFDPDGHLDCSGGATQDVACAVTTAAKAVWHWLSSGSNNTSTSVTTQETYSLPSQTGQQPSLVPRNFSLNAGVSGEFGVYSGAAGSAQISSTYDFKTKHSYGSTTTGGFNNHNNSPGFSPDPTNWVLSAGESFGASVSFGNGTEEQNAGASHSLNVLGFSYAYTGSLWKPGVYQVSIPVGGYAKGLLASHYGVTTTIHDMNPDFSGDVHEVP
jgi:RHS repeat-associated protein